MSYPVIAWGHDRSRNLAPGLYSGSRRQPPPSILGEISPTGHSKLFEHEHAAWQSDCLLVGIDEVGRGPLAGPVVAAAVVLPAGHRGVADVRDSKQVKSRVERETLARAIRREALCLGVGAASVTEIDELNILRATTLAMTRALQRCLARLGNPPLRIVVDGLPVRGLGAEHTAIVKGDSCCHSIAAASLVAKVTRDRWMRRLGNRYPGYKWDSNVGYASRAHIDALRQLGLTPHHRRQFCATVLERQVELVL